MFSALLRRHIIAKDLFLVPLYLNERMSFLFISFALILIILRNCVCYSNQVAYIEHCMIFLRPRYTLGGCLVVVQTTTLLNMHFISV